VPSCGCWSEGVGAVRRPLAIKVVVMAYAEKSGGLAYRQVVAGWFIFKSP
jgi:hypothetical protein